MFVGFSSYYEGFQIHSIYRRIAVLEAHAYAADLPDETVCHGGRERQRTHKCLYKGLWN